MIDSSDIQAGVEAIISLSSQLEEIISHATSDQWKDSHVEEMSVFYELSEKMKELGYEPN